MPATLIRGATVVTMDKQGDLPRADILVRDDRIVDIAPSIAAPDVEVVDAAAASSSRAWSTPTCTPGRRRCAAWPPTGRCWSTSEDACRPGHRVPAAGPVHRHPHGRAQPAELRHHHAGRLVPQQPDAGAQRRRHRGPAVHRHPRGLLPRHAQARPQAGPGAVLGSAAPARRGRAAGEGGTRATRCCPSRRRCWARTTPRWTSRCTTSAWRASWA
jgi:hypothetical protein